MKKFCVIATIAAAVLTVSGCKEEVDLSGEWNVIEVCGEACAQAPGSEYAPHLEFDAEAGRIHGNAGVNIYNANYVLEGNKVTISSQMTTMMAGPRDVMDYERKLLNAINEVKTAKVLSDTTIALCDSAGDTVIVLSKK